VSYLVQVGRYNADDPLDDYEQFVATQYIPDPYYGIEATFSHDVMILVLNGTSSKPPITINRNATIPLPNQSLTIIGLGSINPSVTVLPPILQEVNVDVVINSVCEQAHDNMNDTYQGQITSDMICASNPGKDSCNGDSGGPLVLSDITNDTAATDILVGLASWYVPQLFSPNSL
jgi:secreted trypsin-like serine protease